MTDHRQCTKCCENKTLDNYSIRGKICKTCQLAKHNLWVSNNKAKLKQCMQDAYLRRKSSNPDKLLQQSRDYYARNRDSIREKARLKGSTYDPIRAKEWKLANKELIQEQSKVWRKRNRGKLAARRALRRARQKLATPSWFETDKVQSFYESSDALGMLTGEYYHVDHIVPLVSTSVCGLHTHHNMQILLGVENLSKGNRWWPDMWEPLKDNK